MTKAAVYGYGNVGKEAVNALLCAPDMELCGVVNPSRAGQKTVGGQPIVASLDELPGVQVVILATPSRSVPELAQTLLAKGICTVDSFDIHSRIPEVWGELNSVARANGTAAVTAAGWDPGSDSVIRCLLEAMAPQGITYTNFGPGMSMGHTVAVKAIQGVKEALSVTIPIGTGLHRRMVYVELAEGYALDEVAARIKADDYFAHDETHVNLVKSVKDVMDTGHGVLLERKGASGIASNQNFQFKMSINNPALTAQILVASARAVLRQAPGCYTMIEIPPVDFLPGSRGDAVARLV